MLDRKFFPEVPRDLSVGEQEEGPVPAAQHMLTRDRMTRNLGRGNVAKVFFRCWNANLGGHADLSLAHCGYNPAGLVAGTSKAAMLNERMRLPDFALFATELLGSAYEHRLLGISVNSQNALYTMATAVTPPKCCVCPRTHGCYHVSMGDLLEVTPYGARGRISAASVPAASLLGAGTGHRTATGPCRALRPPCILRT